MNAPTPIIPDTPASAHYQASLKLNKELLQAHDDHISEQVEVVLFFSVSCAVEHQGYSKWLECRASLECGLIGELQLTAEQCRLAFGGPQIADWEQEVAETRAAEPVDDGRDDDTAAYDDWR